MADFRVVLVEPLNDGNVGAIARAMRNFGLSDLVLVRPCHIGEEATKRAMHGLEILKNAKTVHSNEEALKGVDFIAATSGVDTISEKKFVRIALTPKAFSEKMASVKGKVAILFGREDFGLDNELIKRSDFLVTIPANPEYSILNISHAASIVFYELHNVSYVKPGPRPATDLEKEKMHEYFAMLLDSTGYPEHKKEKTKVMFRRLMGRATPTKWEFHTMMGVLDGAIDRSSGGKLPKKRPKKNL